MDFPERPSIAIEEDERPAFAVRFEQVLAEFLCPRVGERSRAAEYAVAPDGLRFARETRSEVRGAAQVHGLDCVEIVGSYAGFQDGKTYENATYVRVWDGRIQTLAAVEDCYGVKYIQSFLDEAFREHYAIGEDNAGLEIALRPRGTIRAQGNRILADRVAPGMADVVGRCRVRIDGRSFDALRLVYFGAEDQVSDFFIAEDGREVLHRFFAPESLWEVDGTGALGQATWPVGWTAERNGTRYRINRYVVPSYAFEG